MRLEDEAFSLVCQEQLAQSWELMSGDDYRRNKREHAEGLASFRYRLKKHSESAICTAHQESLWFLTAATCLGGLVARMLLVGFYGVFRILRLRSQAGNCGWIEQAHQFHPAACRGDLQSLKILRLIPSSHRKSV